MPLELSRVHSLLRTPERLFWDLHSRTWDDLLALQSHREQIRRLVDQLIAAGAKPGERVIDLGCGTGNYSVALAQAGFDVVGIDYSRQMLARAESKLDAQLAKRLRFQCADINAGLPFESHSVDNALCVLVIQIVASRSAFLAEVRRILKPGGLLLAVIPTGAGGSVPPIAMSTARLLFWKIKATASRLGASVYRMPDPAEMLREAGFSIVRSSDASDHVGVASRHAEVLARSPAITCEVNHVSQP